MNIPVTQLTHRLAISLFLVMLLSQGFLLLHGVEHSLAGEGNDCTICLLADHQGHALTSTSQAITSAQFEHLPAGPVYRLTPHHINYFAGRAPPRSLPL